MERSEITRRSFTLVPADNGESEHFWRYVGVDEIAMGAPIIQSIQIRKRFLTSPPPRRLEVKFKEKA